MNAVQFLSKIILIFYAHFSFQHEDSVPIGHIWLLHDIEPSFVKRQPTLLLWVMGHLQVCIFHYNTEKVFES